MRGLKSNDYRHSKPALDHRLLKSLRGKCSFMLLNKFLIYFLFFSGSALYYYPTSTISEINRQLSCKISLLNSGELCEYDEEGWKGFDQEVFDELKLQAQERKKKKKKRKIEELQAKAQEGEKRRCDTPPPPPTDDDE